MLNTIKLQITIAIFWIFLYSLNRVFNTFLYEHSYIFIIFLPAGFKITIACLFEKNIFWGLFFGALITALIFLEDAMVLYFNNNALIYALITAGSPILSIWLINKLLPLGKNLEYLNIQKVLIISVVYSIINSFMHNTYVLLSQDITFEKYQTDSMLMFMGDILGSLLFLTFVSYFRKEIFKIINKYF